MVGCGNVHPPLVNPCVVHLSLMMMDSSTAATKVSQWRPVFVIFTALLFDLLGFTVILPLMPSLLEYYGKTDETGIYNNIIIKVDKFRSFIGAPDIERFNTVLLGGLLGSLYSLLQFFVSPMIGALSDIYGRKPILLLTCSGVLLSYILWSVSYTFPIFIIARVVSGLSKGIVSISAALVTDVTSSTDRSKAMALIGVAFSLGFIFGPTIGAYFSTFGKTSSITFGIFQYPALFAITTSIIVILIIMLLLKETLPKTKRSRSFSDTGILYLVNPVSLFRFSAIKHISKQELSRLRMMSAAYFLYLLLFSGLEYSLTFHVHQRFQYTRMQQGQMFLFIGILMSLVQGGYLRRRPPGTEKRTVLTGMAAIIPGMILIGWAVNPLMLYTGLVFYSFGAGTVVSCLTTVASKFGEGDEKGKVMGIFRSMGALSRAIGPFIACYVFWSYGSCICYMLGGIAITIPLLMVATIDLKSKSDEKKQS